MFNEKVWLVERGKQGDKLASKPLLRGWSHS